MCELSDRENVNGVRDPMSGPSLCFYCSFLKFCREGTSLPLFCVLLTVEKCDFFLKVFEKSGELFIN